MKFSVLMDLVKARGVRVVEMGGGDVEILGVCEDSRRARTGDLFVARGGTKTTGEKFVAEAVGTGAVAVVGNDEFRMMNDERGELRGVSFARVEDVNFACAILAHEVAGNPTAGMTVIGITGTKGKTTVAYLMRSVLKAAGYKVGMIGTVEIDDGQTVVPAEMTTPGVVELVDWFCRMRANGVTHVVMEVSSHALHQRRVAGIDFAVGIFTNLTGDHLDYHKTMEEYAAAKAILFEGLKEGAVAVVNGDDEWAKKMVQQCRARIIECRHGGSAAWEQVLFGIHKMSSRGMLIWIWPLIKPGRSPQHSIRTPLVGLHNAYNIASVYAAGEGLGIDVVKLDQGLEMCNGAPGRLQRVGSKATVFQVFVDYAHTHDALENVLTALRATMHGALKLREGATANMLSGVSKQISVAEQGARDTRGDIGGTPMPRGGRLICVFGCGGDRDRTKRPKMGAVAERLADVVIVTSDNPRTEEPGAIIGEICAGFSVEVRERLQGTHGKADEGVGTTVGTPGGQDARVTVEPDRRVAIRMAIGMAKKGDVVLIAGKGHENYQIIGTTKHHFDDVEEAENALRDVMVHHGGTETLRKT